MDVNAVLRGNSRCQLSSSQACTSKQPQTSRQREATNERRPLTSPEPTAFAAAETSRLLTCNVAAIASWLEPPLNSARRICLFLDISMPLSVNSAPYWTLRTDSRAVPSLAYPRYQNLLTVGTTNAYYSAMGVDPAKSAMLQTEHPRNMPLGCLSPFRLLDLHGNQKGSSAAAQPE